MTSKSEKIIKEEAKVTKSDKKGQFKIVVHNLLTNENDEIFCNGFISFAGVYDKQMKDAGDVSLAVYGDTNLIMGIITTIPKLIQNLGKTLMTYQVGSKKEGKAD